jgi:hypothetical protein
MTMAGTAVAGMNAPLTEIAMGYFEFLLPDLVDHADRDLEQRLMSDLNMLVVTGGKERSATEWKQLLASTGFKCERIIQVPGDLVSIIEAAPAPQ